MCLEKDVLERVIEYETVLGREEDVVTQVR